MGDENRRQFIIDNIKCTLTFNLSDISSLTNSNLIELSSAIKNTKCTLTHLSEFLGYDCSALRRDISTLKKKLSSLRGEKKKKLLEEAFLGSKQPIPKRIKTTETEIFKKISEDQELDTLKQTVISMKDDVEKSNVKVEKLKSENTKLKSDKRRLKRHLTSTSHNLSKKRQKCSELTSQLRLHKIKKSPGDIRKKHREEVTQLKKNLRCLEKEVKEKSLLLQKKDQNIRALDTELEIRKTDADSLENEVKELKKKKEALTESLTYVESLLNDSESKTIITYNEFEKCYTNDMQLCVMNLLSEGVGVKHVNNVITHVTEDLIHKKVSHLPSLTTINRIGDQRAIVSYAQLAEELGQTSDTTLQSDETRKYGQSYEVFAVREGGKEWVIGLRDMINKSSESCLTTLKTIIGDINETTKSQAGQSILASIKNTMSDRAATEKKFHDLLKSYRENILPLVYSNWDDLSSEEQESMARMNNFYCGLHILVNFAETADSVTKKFEENTKEDEVGAAKQQDTKMFTNKEESGGIRLVRTASKCLSRGGDEKSGCFMEFKTFLNEKDKLEKRKKKSSGLLVPFHGNRFNILFYNSEIVFYLANDILEFFDKVHKPANRLQKAVLYDIKEQLHLAILKALGICSKIVTAPFWRALESKDCSVEEASNIYQSLFSFLERTKEDSTKVMCGEDAPLPDRVKKDAVYDKLMESQEYDSTTSALLQQIFAAWHTLLLKAAGDHLPGGRFANLTESMALETASVPTHNKFPERVFALLDQLTRFRPVASTLCNESYIMFSLNKTADWLNSLPTDKKMALLDSSRKEGIELRDKYKERITAIENSRRESLKKRRELIEKKETEKYLQRENLTNDMLYYGLWQSEQMVDSMLKALETEGEKKKALKCQLQFRKLILEQQADKKVFQFSEKGKQYTVDTLTKNVKELIRSALSIQKDSVQSMFVGKRIVHYQLVDNVRTPFNGLVISVVPGYPEWHNVKYDNDHAVYVYKLTDDYEVGDLEIVVEGPVTDQQKTQ